MASKKAKNKRRKQPARHSQQMPAPRSRKPGWVAIAWAWFSRFIVEHLQVVGYFLGASLTVVLGFGGLLSSDRFWFIWLTCSGALIAILIAAIATQDHYWKSDHQKRFPNRYSRLRNISVWTVATLLAILVIGLSRYVEETLSRREAAAGMLFPDTEGISTDDDMFHVHLGNTLLHHDESDWLEVCADSKNGIRN
jgi:hypothetical protein